MMAGKIPHNALIVVADGMGRGSSAILVRATRYRYQPKATLNPINLLNEGPASKRPRESSGQETDEATFARQLAN